MNKPTEWTLLTDLLQRGRWPLLLLSVALYSAISVVENNHRSRQLFSQLQGLREDATEMEMEWGRLLLEYSAWSSHSRIEQIAQDQLGMTVPAAQDIVVLQP